MKRDLSHMDLSELSKLLESNRSLLWQALPTVYHHMHIDGIPPLDSNFISNPKSGLALKAMHVLLNGIIGAKDSVDMETPVIPPRIVTNLLDHWGMIWAWCSFLLKSSVAQLLATSPLSFEQQVKWWETLHPVIIELLIVFSKQSELRTCIGSTPGLVALLVQVWDYEKIFPITEASASNALMCILPIRSVDSWPDLGDSGTIDNIPNICLQRIVSVTSCKRNIPYRPLKGDITILMICTTKIELHRSLLAKNSIAIVLRLVRTLALQVPTTSVRKCLLGLAAYLLRCFEKDGFPTIIRALEERLLVRLFKSAHAVVVAHPAEQTAQYLDRTYGEILDVIAPFTIFRPVLLHSRKSLKTIVVSGANPDRPLRPDVPGHGPFEKAWHKFRNAVSYRMAYKDMYDKEYGGGLHVDFCASPKVNAVASCLSPLG